MSWNIPPLHFLSSNTIYLVQKKSLNTQIFENFEYLVKIRQILYVSFETTSQFLFKLFLIVMTHNSSLDFKLIHFLLWIKGSHQSLNFEILKLLLVKICQIPHVILESTSQFSFKFWINRQCHYSSVHFSSNIIYFVQKEQIKMQIFETFECLGQHSSNSSREFWNGKSIFLQILHHSVLSWHITPL